MQQHTLVYATIVESFPHICIYSHANDVRLENYYFEYTTNETIWVTSYNTTYNDKGVAF